MRALYGERGVDAATLTYVTQLYILPSNLCKPITKICPIEAPKLQNAVEIRTHSEIDGPADQNILLAALGEKVLVRG